VIGIFLVEQEFQGFGAAKAISRVNLPGDMLLLGVALGFEDFFLLGEPE